MGEDREVMKCKEVPWSTQLLNILRDEKGKAQETKNERLILREKARRV